MADRRYRRPRTVEVFAIEDRSLQMVWRDLPPGEVTLSARVQHESRGVCAAAQRIEPAGGLVLDGLDPATAYEVELRLGDATVHRESLATLPSPPGPELYRLATLNDLHIGCAWFGPLGRMREDLSDQRPVSSIRCARAGLDAALAWGAERVVLRGDLVHRGELSEWQAVADLLAGLEVPVDVALGNHETSIRPWRTDLATGLETIGIDLGGPVRTVDLPGADLVIADTAVAHTDPGVIGHVTEPLVAAAASARQPVLVMTHHNMERRREAFTLPRGVPVRVARPFLDRLADVSPASLVSSGHTHRHRRRLHRTIPVVEVGSPKDYPGVWCGYVIHEGGIRQVVRRITAPDCIEWTERTRTSLGGIWGWWSPGSLRDRSFSHSWPVS